jgi:hypothetical protein
MANVSRINGFRVVKHLNGSAYNGQANLYFVSAASDEILVGDVVKLGGTSDVNGIPTVALITAVGDMPVGVVVGIFPSNYNPTGKLTTGSMALDLPAEAQIAAGASGYVQVADAPDITCEVQTSNGTLPLTAVGLNISPVITTSPLTRTSATVSSPMTVDTGTALGTSTLMFKILGFSLKIDNEAAAADAKVQVMFNQHQFGSVGVVGL